MRWEIVVSCRLVYSFSNDEICPSNESTYSHIPKSQLQRRQQFLASGYNLTCPIVVMTCSDRNELNEVNGMPVQPIVLSKLSNDPLPPDEIHRHPRRAHPPSADHPTAESAVCGAHLSPTGILHITPLPV